MHQVNQACFFVHFLPQPGRSGNFNLGPLDSPVLKFSIYGSRVYVDEGIPKDATRKTSESTSMCENTAWTI